MDSAFHQLCPRYNGTLTQPPLRLLDYRKPLPFLPFRLHEVKYVCKVPKLLCLCNDEGRIRKISGKSDGLLELFFFFT